MFNYVQYGNAFLDMRLHQLRVLLTEQTDDIFEKNGIAVASSSVSVVLFLFENSSGSAAKLASSLGYSHQLISHRITQLEAASLVERFPDDQDRRKSVIKLTPLGKKEAKKIKKILPAVAYAIDSALGSSNLNLSAKLADLHQTFVQTSIGERIEQQSTQSCA